ncbi:hypothetical protein KY320_03300 [Candidatus Woesearchaeota archaeon]|nr:hypothetical protein [Candidatus Woesearchaeota archaeon]
MKSLVFDTGPIITLTMNNMLWLLEPLEKRFSGDFFITQQVKKELIDKPLSTKRFKFEALQVLQHVSRGVIKVIDEPAVTDKANELLNLANSCFRAKKHNIKIVHLGEMETVALALHKGSEAIVVDERTTRYLVEKPEKIQEYMGSKMHTQVSVNHDNLKQLKKQLNPLKVIRSVELITLAYELGLLDLFTTERENELLPNLKETLLESVLWGAKLKGCAISSDEIDTIMQLEKPQT